MTQQQFSAHELFCMAKMNGKKKIYGFPDVFSGISAEEKAALLQEARNTLVDRHVVIMDFSGGCALLPEYQALTDICCECSKCLTIEHQIPDGEQISRIFWQKDGTIFTAEAMDGGYVFSVSSPESVVACHSKIMAGKTEPWQEMTVVIANNALKKAKRYVENGRSDDAFCLLCENGMEEGFASLIMDGFCGKGEYTHLRLLEVDENQCRQKEKTWLSSRGEVCVLEETVVNLRTGTSFTLVSPETVKNEIQAMTNTFLQK